MSLDPLVEEPDAGSEVFPYSTSEADHVFPSDVIASSEKRNVTGVSPAIPTLTGVWQINPINLANAVDNDFGTKTSNGKISANTGYIVFDFTTIKGRRIHWKIDYSSGTPFLDSSLDGITWFREFTHLFSVGPTSDEKTIDLVQSHRFVRVGINDATDAFLDVYDVREDEEFFPATSTIDGSTDSLWISDLELNPFLRGEFSGIADKEPSQITLYVDKSKLGVVQFLIQTSPDAVVWTLKRTVNVDQLADLQYNFIRFNRDVLPIRYIRIIGNDSDNRTFSITEFKALIPDEIQWADRQAHKTISTTGIVGLSG